MSKGQLLVGIGAMVVSVGAFIVSAMADKKVNAVEVRVNKTVDGLSGITSDVINARASDGLINEAIRIAAENKVRHITRDVTDKIREGIEKEIQQVVYTQYRKILSELNIKAMVKQKAKHIIRNLTAYDISSTLEDDIKKAVIGELKDSIRQKVTDSFI